MVRRHLPNVWKGGARPGGNLTVIDERKLETRVKNTEFGETKHRW